MSLPLAGAQLRRRVLRRVAASVGALGIAIIACAASAAPAGAALGAEVIDSITVDLTVHADGTLDVIEIIAYDFGSSSKHGIIRLIPDLRRFDSHHDRRYPFTLKSVTASGGASDQVKLSRSGAYRQIRIGDPKRTTTGAHVYTIAYTVRGAYERYADHDELNWNAVGTEWNVPIQSVTVRLHALAAVTKVACYAGYAESRLPCGNAAIAEGGTGAVYSNGPLSSNQGVTIVAAMPKGTISDVAPILVKHWTADQGFTVSSATVGSAVAVALALIGGVVFLAWRVGRDRRYVGSATDAVFGNPTGANEPVGVFEDHTTPVEYTPPEQLRPGQVGTLVDEVAGPLDVSATIVDLAVRKYLKIEEIPKEGWFGHPDWRLTRLEFNDPLLKYERLLLDSLFAGTDGTVLLSSLKKKFSESLLKVESALYDDAVARGWFLRRPDKARSFWRMMAILLVVGGIGLTYVLARWTSLGLIGIAVVPAGLVLLACAHAMPRRTPKGTATTRRVLGFRRFIAESERDRAKFAEQAQLFSEYLPYAIVFGVVDRWAKTFEGLALQPDVSWYQSSTPFNALVFSHAINGFAVTSVGTLQSTPSGSAGSGFSGGGSSGGGGGGGGGGSW